MKRSFSRSAATAAGVILVAALGIVLVAAHAHPGDPFGTQASGPGFGPGGMPGMPGFPHAGRMGPGMMAGRMGPPAGMGGPAAQNDPAFGADMALVHDMLHGHERIKRNVMNLPDGIRTVTESDDPEMAKVIQAHVASVVQRLGDGRVFNLFSPTLPILFANRDKIRTDVQTTEKGAVVTQTSTDHAVVAALQAHAAEVSDLAREGPVAMMRGMRAAMNR